MSDAHAPPPLSPAEALRIDQACDRFEAAWKAGRRPALEEYLDAAAEPERSALLRQLLLLEWDYRRSAGEEPRPGEYHARFPGDTALVEAVGRELAESPDSTHPGSGGHHPGNTPWPGSGAPGGGGAGRRGEGGAARYELLQVIGHGGIGVVFRGRDRVLGRELAVKVLREDYRGRPAARRRFLAEARVGSQLQHPAIVPVYGLGWFDGRRPYITMKLVEGHTLAALLQGRAGPGQDLPRYLGIFEQVCQAVAYAHSKGVVHRDLKPANVMVGAFGEVQVMDWGFAKVLAGGGPPDTSSPEGGAAGPAWAQSVRGATRLSQSGAVMGTPAYMPPEQARGEAALLDARADVFALGAILCEVLTGCPPYAGETGDEVCRRAAAGDLGEAHARLDACGADQALRGLVKRCLAAERLARPADAGAVARDLAAYLASAQERLRQAQMGRAAAEARAQESAARARAERHARRLTLALAAAAAVFLTLGAAGWWWYDRVQQAHALRVAATDSKVEAALAEAAESVSRSDWPRAGAAATRARELHATGASAHWKGRIDEVLADLSLVTELDDIHLLQANFDRAKRRFHREKALPRFAEAFGRYGIHPGAGPAEVAARLVGRPAPVRDTAVAGLENWWLLALGWGDPARDWLWEVLQAADPDEWRVRVRRAVAKSDRRALEQLAAQVDADLQPPGTLNALAEGLMEVKAYDATIALLRQAQLRHPRDFWMNLRLAIALDSRQPPDYAGALRFHSIARSLRPGAVDDPAFASHLIEQRDWDGAIFVLRKAIELHPGSAEAYDQLGCALYDKGDWERAQAAFRRALELNPGLASAHNNLGRFFYHRGQAEEARAAFERAVRIDPGNPKIHYNLGNARFRRKDFDAALAAYEKAIELSPGFAPAHRRRGDVLMEKGRLDDAVAACEQAVRLAPTSHEAHGTLGSAWQLKGRLDRALAAHSRAVELSPGSVVAQYNLGCALQAVTDWGGAAAAYREAIRLDPNAAEAYCNLRQVLQEQGRLAEALAAIERGHRLGSARPDWRYPSAGCLQEARRVVELDAKLPGVLRGREKPATLEEQIDYALVCRFKGLYGASARLYASAFSAAPAVAASLEAKHRHSAARAAALAGTAQGRDVPALGAEERVRWRKQALDWLRADLAVWADRLGRSPNSRFAVRNALQRWQREKALAGIREPEELAKLPELERAGYLRFWADVQEVIVRCLATSPGK